MTTRRTLIKGATTAVLGAATVSTKVLAAPITQPSLEPLMERQLARALGDEGVARKLAPLLFDVTMLWSYPQMQAQEADSLIAYSFGNRLAPGADAQSLEPRHPCPARSTPVWPRPWPKSARAGLFPSMRNGKSRKSCSRTITWIGSPRSIRSGAGMGRSPI